MNRTERRYADYLQALQAHGEIDAWWYEAVKLTLGPNTTYKPDFLVISTNGQVYLDDVKGASKGKPRVEDDAAVKIKLAAQKFPHFWFRIAYEDGKWTYREVVPDGR